jgi:ankyrin repeat protein
MGRRLWCWIEILGLMGILSGCAHLDGKAVDDDALFNAIQQDDVAKIRRLVESRALSVDQSVSVPGYREGTPLITVAARSAALGVLRYLITAGADIDARTPVNETALMLAAFFYSEDRVRGVVSRARHDEAVRLLLASGAALENDPYNYTALSYAAYQGHDTAVRLLLARGAQVDADARNGETYINTPLMMAAMQGHLSTVVELLRAGANPAIRVRGGHTAAELAAKYQHGEVARLLQCAERPGAPGIAQRCAGTMAARPAPPATFEETAR